MTTSDETSDTLPDADAFLIELIRAKPASHRLDDAISASNRVAEQCKEAIRRSNPRISEDEVRIRFIELNYGIELADQVREFVSRKR